jgi:hypothetical protein
MRGVAELIGHWYESAPNVLLLQHFHSIYTLYDAGVRRNKLAINHLDYVTDLHCLRRTTPFEAT